MLLNAALSGLVVGVTSREKHGFQKQKIFIRRALCEVQAVDVRVWSGNSNS
jgi:hypothetical protein